MSKAFRKKHTSCTFSKPFFVFVLCFDLLWSLGFHFHSVYANTITHNHLTTHILSIYHIHMCQFHVCVLSEFVMSYVGANTHVCIYVYIVGLKLKQKANSLYFTMKIKCCGWWATGLPGLEDGGFVSKTKTVSDWDVYITCECVWHNQRRLREDWKGIEREVDLFLCYILYIGGSGIFTNHIVDMYPEIGPTYINPVKLFFLRI